MQKRNLRLLLPTCFLALPRRGRRPGGSSSSTPGNTSPVPQGTDAQGKRNSMTRAAATKGKSARAGKVLGCSIAPGRAARNCSMDSRAVILRAKNIRDDRRPADNQRCRNRERKKFAFRK